MPIRKTVPTWENVVDRVFMPPFSYLIKWTVHRIQERRHKGRANILDDS